MSNPHIVRSAERRDVPRIGAIAEATELFPASMLPDMIAGYLDGSRRDVWLVDDAGDGAVGFGFCEPERMTEGTWSLLAIGVLPGWQGARIGTGLLAALEARLVAAGGRLVLVDTLGTPEFARTREFYRRSGFVEEARIRDFYEPGGDKVVFWKRLEA